MRNACSLISPLSAAASPLPVPCPQLLFLSPYLLLELHYFTSMLSSFSAPLTQLLDLLLPVAWIRSIMGAWLLDVASLSLSVWTAALDTLDTLSAPLRWVNGIVSPLLEAIRQEMRAMWGLSVLVQPVLAAGARIQAELVRLWGAIGGIGGALAAFMPTRVFTLFGVLRSGAEATAAVGSSAASVASAAAGGASSGVGLMSRLRSTYQSMLEFCQLIGKWKVVVDRVRLNIQVYYYEALVYVDHARRRHRDKADGVNTNLDVPFLRALERTRSELDLHRRGEYTAAADTDADTDVAVAPEGEDGETTPHRAATTSQVEAMTVTPLPRRSLSEATPPSPSHSVSFASPPIPFVLPSSASSSGFSSLVASSAATPILLAASPAASAGGIEETTPFDLLPSPPAFELGHDAPPHTFSGFDSDFSPTFVMPPPPASIHGDEKYDANNLELDAPSHRRGRAWAHLQADIRKRGIAIGEARLKMRAETSCI